MNHMYEVIVDMKEYDKPTANIAHLLETHYEISAESKGQAYGSALVRASNEHPKASEYNARVVRVLY